MQKIHLVLKKKLRQCAKKIIQYIIYCFDFDSFMIKSYSQEGEDMILRRLFEKQSKGFYLDIGAHHPKRFSNTFIFYKRGWSGINIDAMPKSMRIFQKERSRDINLEIPIAEKKQTLKYFLFDEPALNTFDEELALSREQLTSYYIIETKEIDTYPLKDVLEQYLKSNSPIDIMSVDVEGLDLQVLQSNDWGKFRPKVVLVEILKSSLDSIQDSSIYQFLKAQNYWLYAKTVHTVFFVSYEFFS